MKKVLITGCAGHLGSKLAAYALEQGAAVFGVDDLSGGYRESVPAGVDFRVHDLSVDADFGNQRFDYVFHCAAYAAECMSPFVRVHNYQSNVISTMRVLNHVLRVGCERFVYFSSIAAYGTPLCYDTQLPRDGVFDERDWCFPHDPYGTAKLACEWDLRVAHEQHGLDYVVLRPHNVYGPGQSIWQAHRNVFGLWMRAVLEKKPVVVFGDGGQRRAFSYVDDVVPCVWRAAGAELRDQRVINLGGSAPTTIMQALTEFVCALDGVEVEVQHHPPRHEVRDAWCTTRLSEELLSYSDSTPLCAGLENMWTWAQDAWRRYPNRRKPGGVSRQLTVELERGMPPAWRTF
jgi:UDP-glucose 4-epimerase